MDIVEKLVKMIPCEHERSAKYHPPTSAKPVLWHRTENKMVQVGLLPNSLPLRYAF